MTPNISVIIRTTGRPSLRRAIESVEQQNRSDVEIVIVAAKPDVAPVDSRICTIRWLATDVPLHRCAAANAGLQAAQGQYLIFLDDDDWFECGHLEKLIVALENHPDAVAAHTGVRMQSEAGEFLADFDLPFEPWQLIPVNRFPIHAVLFRQAAVKAGQCQFDARFDVYEDWDFWLQLQKVGRFVHVPGVSAVYLHTATGSASHSIPYGDAPYQKLWQKWGGLYDSSWLASLFEQTNQIPSLRAKIGQRESKIEQLESELTASRQRERLVGAELVAVRESERSLKAHLEQVARDLHAVLNSRSWKLTAGPRRLVQCLRQLRNRYFQSPARAGSIEALSSRGYAQWIAKFDTVTADQRRAMLEEISGWPAHPLISVVMPVYNPPIRLLRDAIDSIRSQIYPDWELCIADDASTDPQVRKVLADYAQRDARIRVVYRSRNGHIVEASNSALDTANGEFVALLDQDDLLPAHALFEVAKAMRNHPDAGVIYSDEDKISEGGTRFEPYFKPDYNYELLLGQNMLSHLGAYRRTLLQEIGGFKEGMEGSQDHDLALRCIERLAPAQVIHILKVLYHWRARSGSTAASADEKPYAIDAGIRAVNEHLNRTCPGASVRPNLETPSKNYYRIYFPLPIPVPKVSIIIPTRDAYGLVRVCLDTLFQKTRYANFEVIVVDNGSDEPALLDYLDGLARAGKITVLRDDSPFNFPALNNRAVARSSGEYVLLLNNDIEIMEPDWLAEMVSVAARPGVGAVGARLWYPNQTLQHGGVIIGLGGVAGHAHAGIAAGNAGYFGRAVLLQSFSAVTAACLLVKRSIYDEVGGLDEKNLTVAFNDVDFCLKIVQAGYRNVWTPHAQLIHHESATRGKDLAPEKADRFRSEVRFMAQKWADFRIHDPAFNINLSLNDPCFVLADAPRDRGEPTGPQSTAQ